MNRVYGSSNTPLIECINRRIPKYRIRYDMVLYESNGEDGVSFLEHEISHKPTMNEVRKVVLNGYNEAINGKIASGFEWKGMKVWLSAENQFNYKAAYDLAVQTNGAYLPVVFKFGTTENPIYHKFDTLEELQDFYIKAMSYIDEQLTIGWSKKDAIDWSKYEEALNA